MQTILILGAGGHAQVLADIVQRCREHGQAVMPIGYLDDNTTLQNQIVLQLPVLGALADLIAIKHDSLLLGIGDNNIRCSLYERLQATGEHFFSAIHPSATIGSDVTIGPSAVLCAGTVVNPASYVGANVILNTGCTVDHHNWIGPHAHIAPGAHLGGDVRVGEGVLIGIGATIMPQRRIGKWAVVGAGAVVTEDVPDYATVVGVPAQVVKRTLQ